MISQLVVEISVKKLLCFFVPNFCKFYIHGFTPDTNFVTLTEHKIQILGLLFRNFHDMKTMTSLCKYLKRDFTRNCNFYKNNGPRIDILNKNFSYFCKAFSLHPHNFEYVLTLILPAIDWSRHMSFLI